MLSGYRHDLILGRQHLRLEVLVEDATGALVDLVALDGLDWVDGVEISHDLDRAYASAQLSLHRERQRLTLSQLSSSSWLNREGPLLDVGRRVEIYVTLGGVRYHVFRGRIEQIDFGTDPVRVLAYDDAYELQQTFIETERIYGSDAGTPVETVMQQILDDNLGAGAPALVVPTSPGWLIKPYVQQKEMLWEALERLADQIGWDLRYRYDEGSGLWRLTLLEPRRSITSPDATIPSGAILDVRQLSVTRAFVRNRVRIYYGPELSDGSRSSILREDATSIGRYGVRYMEIVESASSQIDTLTEAQRMADAILADLAYPDVSYQITVPFFPWSEIGDYYSVEPTELHDQPVTAAVVSITHVLRTDAGETVLTLRGKPRSAYRRWYYKDARGQQARPTVQPPSNVQATSGLDQTQQVVLPFVDVSWDPPPGLTYQFALRWREQGGAWTQIVLRATSYRIEPVLPGRTYEIQVRAILHDGRASDWAPSTPVTVVAAGDGTAPGAPIGLTADAVPGAVRLKWTAPADEDLDEFRVYRNTASNFATAQVVGDVAGTTFVDTSGDYGTTYYYWVTALDRWNNESPPAGPVSAMVPYPEPDARAPLGFDTVSISVQGEAQYFSADGNAFARLNLEVVGLLGDSLRSHSELQIKEQGTSKWRTVAQIPKDEEFFAAGWYRFQTSVDDLATGTTYKLRVVPVSHFNIRGTPSPEVTYTTAADSVAPPAPSVQFEVRPGAKWITTVLLWTALHETIVDIEYYEIEFWEYDPDTGTMTQLLLTHRQNPRPGTYMGNIELILRQEGYIIGNVYYFEFPSGIYLKARVRAYDRSKNAGAWGVSSNAITW